MTVEMGMTVSQKILASHCGRASVETDDLVSVKVDLLMANDGTAPLAIREFQRLGVPHVFDPTKIAFVLSHSVPNKNLMSATQVKPVREFARKHGLRFFYEGHGGIEHVVIPAEGLVLPGDVFVGADSHTTTEGALCAFSCGMGSTDIAVAMATGETWMKVPATKRFIYHGRPKRWVEPKDIILHTIGKIGLDGARYCSMQFEGEAVANMSMEQRFTLCNMAAEAGAKNAIMLFDSITEEYVAQRSTRSYDIYVPDPDCEYEETYEWDVSSLDPQVAVPFSPDNVIPVQDLAPRDIRIDQVFIGSCTNGRTSDMRNAASVLKGSQVAPWVRCIVIPGSDTVFRECLHEGLLDLFTEAGCVVGTPTCGPCGGGQMGILAKGEKCLSTSNRNFRGRMGHVDSEVYLANPFVAAASAVLGRIVHPSELAVP
jgi:3-isopropylmalate/(R)-2-methylmalate dehydratase large subunit